MAQGGRRPVAGCLAGVVADSSERRDGEGPGPVPAPSSGTGTGPPLRLGAAQASGRPAAGATVRDRTAVGPGERDAPPAAGTRGQRAGQVARAARAFSVRRAAQQPSAPSQTKISRRRSKRSASTPPYRPNTTSGTSSTAPSRPTATVDPVSCLACTSSATSVAWVPSAMTVRLAYSSRKSREVRSGVRPARSLGRLNAARALGLPWREAVVQARRRRYCASQRPRNRVSPVGRASPRRPRRP